MLRIITTPQFISGILTLEDLQRDYSSQLPKIGDILIAKVASVVKFKKSGTFGTFVNIATYSSRRGPVYLSGLLHESNLNKKSPWSIWNKNDYFPEYNPVGDKIIVEVASISKKGYALKELDPANVISIEKIVQPESHITLNMHEAIMKTRKIGNWYSGKYYEIKEETPAVTIKYNSTLEAFVLDDKIFMQYHQNHFLTWDTMQSIIFKDRSEMKYDKGFDKNRTNINWLSSGEILRVNRSEKGNYERFMSQKKKEAEKKLFFDSLIAKGPDKVLKMYISIEGRYFMHNLNTKDEWNIDRYTDNEKIVYVYIYSLENSTERYIRVNTSKFYLESPGVILFDDECFVHDFIDEALICFKFGVPSSSLIEKYQASDQIHSFAKSVLNRPPKEGERRSRPH